MTKITTETITLPKVGSLGTIAHFCSRYQISRTTWWRWSKSPDFPARIQLGRVVRWPVEAVDAFLISQGA